MDHPINDVQDVILKLVEGSPSAQQDAIKTYFTPDASFTNPFCWTGSSKDSRWYILQLYRWCKIMSPDTKISIKSIAYDDMNKLLYVSMHRNFKVCFNPFYRPSVSLTTVLTLTNDPQTPTREDATKNTEEKDRQKRQREERREKLYIKDQNDLYQITELVKFIFPFFGIGVTVVLFWQLFVTFGCLIVAFLGSPMIWWISKEDERGQTTKTTNGPGASNASNAQNAPQATVDHAVLAAEVGHNS